MIEQLIGQSLGRYRIQSLIGEGGMGSVLRGFDEALQRDVAIKLLSAHFMGQPNFRERFLQEARSAARLRHPGIVQVYDFGQAPGLLYIVMEFIPGDNLHQLLKRLSAQNKRMILAEAIQLMRQLSLAVDYAHRNGVLHRDIKPANIMLREEPGDGLPYQPILTDLGLAKLAEGGIVTAVGTSMGTPAYMSPEQALGESTTVRSDVYSMGVLLFELASGRLPFPAKSITDAIRYHVKEPPPRPSSIRPELAGPVEEAILQALEKEPDHRFPDAAALSSKMAELAKVVQRADKPAPAAQGTSLFTLYQPSLVAQEEKHRAQLQAQDQAQDRLMVMMRDQTTKTIPLTADGLTIGRGSDNDLVLNQTNVSRYHARIEHDGQDYRVVDLNSTNGTHLNDAKLLPQVPEILNPGSVLRIGDTWMRRERSRPAGPSAPSIGVPVAYSGAMSGAILAKSVAEQIAVQIQSSQLAVNPGESTDVTITILNQGRRVDHFRVSVTGIPSSWVKRLPEPVQLMPGEQRTVSFSISPPRSSESAARSHPFTIRVDSTANPEQIAELELNLTLGAFQSFTADLRPQKRSGVQEAIFTVQLHNGGNAPLQIGLEAIDREDRCTFSFDPPMVTVPAGQDGSVALLVRSKIPLFDDTPRLHQITVTARPLNAPELTRTLPAQWEQRMPAFELALKPPEQSSISSADYVVVASNRTGERLELDLEVMSATDRCVCAIKPTSLSLEPGQEEQAQLRVVAKAPLPTASAENHVFTLTARPSAAPSKVEQLTGEWHQIPPSFAVTLQPQQQSSMSAARYTVLVANRVQEKVNIQLEVADAGGNCSFNLDPQRFSLNPGQTQEVLLLVEAKALLPGGVARRHSFTVSARPAEAPGVIKQAQGEWEQTPPRFETELRPETYSSRMKAHYSLQIRNLSAEGLIFRSTAVDERSELRFAVEPGDVPVSARGSGRTTITVQPVKRLKGGEPRDHRFSVSTKATLAPEVISQVYATWQQLPGGRSPAAFLFLGLIAWFMIIIGWFFALRLWPEMADFGLVSLAEGLDSDLFFNPFTGAMIMGTAGFIGGLATGIAIRLVEPSSSLKKAILCAFFWAITVGFGWVFLPSFIPIGVLSVVLSSAFGGLLTALLLRGTDLPISGLAALAIAFGWGLASIPLLMEVEFIPHFLFGGVGGLVLLWQIGRARGKLE